MNTIIPHAAAVRAYRDQLTDTRNLHDDALNPDGLAAKQRAAIEQARARLLATRPVLPAELSADDVLADLAPRTADSIARMQHEQTKIAALLAAGRSVSDMLATASTERAIALVDMLETLPEVLASSNAAEIMAEQRAAVFDRLADLGVEQAVSARDRAREWAPARAWDRVIAGTAEGGASVAD